MSGSPSKYTGQTTPKSPSTVTGPCPSEAMGMSLASPRVRAIARASEFPVPENQ